MSSYNPNIPQPNDILADSQGDLLQNFQSLDTYFGINHVQFSVTPNTGKHTYVEMINKTDPVGAALQGTFFTKNSGTSSDVYYKPDAGANVYQITAVKDANFSTFGNQVAYGSPPVGFTQEGGWTFLPGNVLLQWGYYGNSPANLGSSGTIAFPVAFTGVPFSVQVSLYRNSGNQSITISSATPPTNANFSFLTSSSGSEAVFWYAIGRR